MGKKPASPSRDPRFSNAYMAFVDDIRGIVWRWISGELISESAAAKRAGLHPRTVVNFLTGKTMAPQLPTLYKLLQASGAELTVTEPGKRPRPVGKRQKPRAR